MAQQGIKELVGRAMIDQDFLAELRRAPETAMAQYELSHEEREALLKAVRKLGSVPSHQYGRTLQAVLVKRWAT
jgi:hypothetical protein